MKCMNCRKSLHSYTRQGVQEVTASDTLFVAPAHHY